MAAGVRHTAGTRPCPRKQFATLSRYHLLEVPRFAWLRAVAGRPPRPPGPPGRLLEKFAPRTGAHATPSLASQLQTNKRDCYMRWGTAMPCSRAALEQWPTHRVQLDYKLCEKHASVSRDLYYCPLRLHLWGQGVEQRTQALAVPSLARRDFAAGGLRESIKKIKPGASIVCMCFCCPNKLTHCVA